MRRARNGHRDSSGSHIISKATHCEESQRKEKYIPQKPAVPFPGMSSRLDCMCSHELGRRQTCSTKQVQATGAALAACPWLPQPGSQDNTATCWPELSTQGKAGAGPGFGEKKGLWGRGALATLCRCPRTERLCTRHSRPRNPISSSPQNHNLVSFRQKGGHHPQTRRKKRSANSNTGQFSALKTKNFTQLGGNTHVPRP